MSESGVLSLAGRDELNHEEIWCNEEADLHENDDEPSYVVGEFTEQKYEDHDVDWSEEHTEVNRSWTQVHIGEVSPSWIIQETLKRIFPMLDIRITLVCGEIGEAVL